MFRQCFIIFMWLGIGASMCSLYCQNIYLAMFLLLFEIFLYFQVGIVIFAGMICIVKKLGFEEKISPSTYSKILPYLHTFIGALVLHGTGNWSLAVAFYLLSFTEIFCVFWFFRDKGGTHA